MNKCYECDSTNNVKSLKHSDHKEITIGALCEICQNDEDIVRDYEATALDNAVAEMETDSYYNQLNKWSR